MLIKTLLLFVVLGGLLVAGEYIRRRFAYSNEVSRKLVHILHGVGLAILTFIVPIWMVILLEVGFLLMVMAARYLYANQTKKSELTKYLSEMYRVGRLSYGEFFFPVSVILCALLANSKWVFVAALLVLALADTIAALVGKTYGKTNTYVVFGQKKSVVGSVAFFAVALLVIWFCASMSGGLIAAPLIMLIGLAICLALVENLGVYGSDNFLIPLATVLALNWLTLLPN